jgi:hypothetical protein
MAKHVNRPPLIDKSKISQSDPLFATNEKGEIFGLASFTA